MTTEEALEVFGTAATIMRSFTYPCVLERFGQILVFRDAPREKQDYRNEEWIVHGLDAKEADEIIQVHRRERYAVCALKDMDEPEGAFKAAYKKLGYRLTGTEMFFVHRFTDVPEILEGVNVERVLDEQTAEELKVANGRRQILPEHLNQDPPTIRQYIVRDGDEIVGWVRSVRCGDKAWCSNLYVRPTHRRKGIGRNLMTRMLIDDKRQGLMGNVLLASHAGAMLYPQLGYEAIGQLFIFTKPKR